MTLREWRERAPLLLDAFVAATELHQQAKEDGFVGPEFEDRDEVDWAREFAAYMQFADLQEEAGDAGR